MVEQYPRVQVYFDEEQGIPKFEIAPIYYETLNPEKEEFVLKYPIPQLVKECIGLVGQMPENKQNMKTLNKLVNQRLSVMIQKNPDGMGRFELKQRK